MRAMRGPPSHDTEMRLPLVVFVLSFAGQALALKTGIHLRGRFRALDDDGRRDFSVIQGATLTLLGIIIGFSFSMAVSRYDQRKSCEEEEANAIGTEYLRLGLLPATDASKARTLLKKYLDQRVAFYEARDPGRLEQINRDTARIQNELWSAVQKGAVVQQAAVTTFTLGGLNDALNSQGYTQAAWLNRIPVAAWIMMETIALFGNLLVGIGAYKSKGVGLLLLPFVLSAAFFLIADLDSPRRGLIRVRPGNLLSLAESLSAY
jgi:hypothetical protein